MRNAFKKGLEFFILGAIATAAALGSVDKVKADEGQLNIYDVVNGSSPRLILGNYDGAQDLPWISPQSGNPGLYSVDGSGNKFKEDWESSNNINPFKIGLVYNGTITTSLENHLSMTFPWAPDSTFGSQYLTLQEVISGTPTGPRYDVRKIIDGTLGDFALNPSAGVFELDSLSPGTYSPNTPYAIYQIDFQPVTSTPEPSSFALLGAAATAASLAVIRRRKFINKGKFLTKRI